MQEYQGMKAFILDWTEKAETMVTSSIVWSSTSQLQEQIRAHQASMNEQGIEMVLRCMKLFVKMFSE